ncbi:DUF551 domain-containing protein [Escherichia coli]|nr:DUF551 domain-containing protein [Escherichia coli]EHO5840784.1 DUF551 domain-containing protein [Escherichia coli]EKA0305867.1 DUF551 domain-containing protein [Escherichia coli]
MITITKERLLTIQQWRETYGPGSNVVLPAEEAEELARIALASLEAKPIGAFHIAEQQVDGTSDYLKDGEWPIDNGIIEVYAAPPVPVVPEEKPMPNPLSMYAVDAVAAIAEVRGWNACRAAMLQSQNNGIKDGWISCSERMPPQDDWILIYSKHGEYMAGQVQGEYVELSDGTLSWLGNALFWMPLPEPPQEVNRG